jgi:hypothetical protein
MAQRLFAPGKTDCLVSDMDVLENHVLENAAFSVFSFERKG